MGTIPFLCSRTRSGQYFMPKKINCGTKLTYVPVSSLFTERITSSYGNYANYSVISGSMCLKVVPNDFSYTKTY